MLLSVMSTLYAMVWIMAFQVVMATTDRKWLSSRSGE